MSTKVEELERRVESALSALLRMQTDGTLPPILEPLLALAPPRGMEVEVQLRRVDRDHSGRANEWSPQVGEIVVSFFEAEADTVVDDGRDATRDLIAVLMQAEQNPALSFVALKFLRDRLLPQTQWPWTRSMDACQEVIAEAIDDALITTSKKPNPRNPAFPVTAVQLNRDHPRVRVVLAEMPDEALRSTERERLAEQG